MERIDGINGDQVIVDSSTQVVLLAVAERSANGSQQAFLSPEQAEDVIGALRRAIATLTTGRVSG